MRNTSIESPQEETTHSEENLFLPTMLHHPGIFNHASEEFTNGQEDLTRKRPLNVMGLRRRYPLEEEEEEQSLLDEEHEPQNGIRPPTLDGSGTNVSAILHARTRTHTHTHIDNPYWYTAALILLFSPRRS